LKKEDVNGDVPSMDKPRKIGEKEVKGI